MTTNMETTEDDIDMIVKKGNVKFSDSAIAGNLFLQLPLMAILFISFVILRRYFYKIYTKNVQNKKKHPAYDKKGFFGWLESVITINDSDMLSLIGLDAFIYLQTIHLIFRIVFILMIVVGVIMASFYFFTNNPNDTFKQIFLRFSIPTKNKDSLVLAILLTTMTIFTTIIVIYSIYVQYRKIIALKQTFIRSPVSMTSIPTLKRAEFERGSQQGMIDLFQISSKTVLINRIPDFIKTDSELKDFIDSFELGEVVEWSLAKDTSSLKALQEEKEKTVLALEKNIHMTYLNMEKYLKSKNVERSAEYLEKPDHFDDRKKIEILMEIVEDKELCPNKEIILSKIEHLKKIYEDIKKEQDLLMGVVKEKKDVVEIIKNNHELYSSLNIEKNTEFFSWSHMFNLKKQAQDVVKTIPTSKKSAFITFKHQKSASILSQSLISSKIFSCKASIVPQPNDILWGNLHISELSKYIRKLCSSIVIGCLCVFFIFLSIYTIKLLDIERVSKIPLIEKVFDKYPFLKGALGGVLGPIAYSILNILIPIFLTIIIGLETHLSKTGEYRRLMVSYTYFHLFNGFLIFIIFNILLELSKSIPQKDASIELGRFMGELSVSILNSSLFFFNIMIQRLCVSTMLGFLKIGIFLKGIFYYLTFGKKTTRQKYNDMQTLPINYGLEIPAMLSLFPIIICYSIISPLILFIGAGYYFIYYYVQKVDFIFNSGTEIETGGSYWNFCANFILNVLMIFQTLMLIQLLVKENRFLALCIIPILILTHYFKKGIIPLFQESCMYYPLNALEEQYTDDFTKEILRSKLETLDNWDEDLNKLEENTIRAHSFGMEESGVDKNLYPYNDPIMAKSVTFIFLPKRFFSDYRKIKELRSKS